MQGVIFIGLQGSGKSTFFQQRFYDTHIRLNMDMLRTRHREKLLLQACLHAKQPFVLDNTNPSKSARLAYIEQMKQHRFAVHGYYFHPDFESCLARNAQREGKQCVPEIGMKATLKQLERPSYDEGFDALYYVQLTPQGFSVEEWQHEI